MDKGRRSALSLVTIRGYSALRRLPPRSTLVAKRVAPGGFGAWISVRESGRVRRFRSGFPAPFRRVPQTHELGTAALSDVLCPVPTGWPACRPARRDAKHPLSQPHLWVEKGDPRGPNAHWSAGPGTHVRGARATVTGGPCAVSRQSLPSDRRLGGVPFGLLRGQLGVDDGQPFKERNVAEPLVGADEVIEGCCLMNPQGHG
jgi:hypothetical protein